MGKTIEKVKKKKKNQLISIIQTSSAKSSLFMYIPAYSSIFNRHGVAGAGL